MDRVAFSSDFGGSVVKPTQLAGRVDFTGVWAAEAVAPVRFADPDQVLSILRRENVAVPRRVSQGVLSDKELRWLLPQLRQQVRRDFERLLEGGGVVWREEWINLVVDAGVTYILDAGLSGGTPITSWYVLIMQAASSPSSSLPTIAAGNTMGSHAGWAEVTAYDEATREAWVEAGVSAKSVTNSASPAEFTIDTNTTYISGAALTSGSAKSGTTGTLYAAGAFGSVRTLNDNEVLRVTAAMGG